MEIDFELYKIFVSVASNGSLSKAADELSVTQSAVSQSILKLEHIFEKELFIRSRQGVKLTEFGMRLFEEINPSIKQLSFAFNKIQNSATKDDIIKIGASDTIARNIVLPVIKKKFRDRHFYIDSLMSDKEKILAVENGQLDFAIINDYSLPLGSNINKRKLLTLEYSFFYNKNQVAIDENNIFDSTLIIKNSGTKGRNEFNKKYYSLVSKFKNVLELSHDDTIIEAVRCGLGIGFCPKQYLTEKFEEVKLSNEVFIKNIVLIFQQRSEIINEFLS